MRSGHGKTFHRVDALVSCYPACIPVSARSIRRYRGRGPARPPSQSWRTFPANHAQAIWAVDQFVVPTLTFQTLYVFFLISHRRRRLLHFDVTAHPSAA